MNDEDSENAGAVESEGFFSCFIHNSFFIIALSSHSYPTQFFN